MKKYLCLLLTLMLLPLAVFADEAELGEAPGITVANEIFAGRDTFLSEEETGWALNVSLPEDNALEIGADYLIVWSCSFGFSDKTQWSINTRVNTEDWTTETFSVFYQSLLALYNDTIVAIDEEIYAMVLRARMQTLDQTPTALDGILSMYLDKTLEKHLREYKCEAVSTMLISPDNGKTFTLRLSATGENYTGANMELTETGIYYVTNRGSEVSIWDDLTAADSEYSPTFLAVSDENTYESRIEEIMTAAIEEGPKVEAQSELQEISGTVLTWPAGRTYPIYGGPTESYGRLGAGKAIVSTKGEITTWGEWEGAVLVSYNINKYHDRFGWIMADEVPESILAEQPSLITYDDYDQVSCAYATLTDYCHLTDDPLKSKEYDIYLKPGASVKCLFTLGEWVYIEAFKNEDDTVMGFVPLKNVDMEHGYTADTVLNIDTAGVFTEDEINRAAEDLKSYIENFCPGVHLITINYVDEENPDSSSTDDDVRLRFYCDISMISLHDYEIAGEVAEDYIYTLFRTTSGSWMVCNYGYE